jgi:hypothetical protein
MATTTTQRDPITFTDGQMENEKAITAFLDVIYTWSIKDVGHEDSVGNIHLIEFARKWECQPIIEMISRDITYNIKRPKPGDIYEQFLLAIGMDNYELAADCLRYRPIMPWSGEPSANPPDPVSLHSRQPSVAFLALEPLEGHNVFDMSASNFACFTELPLDVVWALLRSWNIAKSANIEGKFETMFGDEFVKIMRTACE